MVKVFNSPLLIAALAALVATNARGASADPAAAESIRALAEAETESPEVIDWRAYYGVSERRALEEAVAQGGGMATWYPGYYYKQLRDASTPEELKQATRALKEAAAQSPEVIDWFKYYFGQKLRGDDAEVELQQATRALKEAAAQSPEVINWRQVYGMKG